MPPVVYEHAHDRMAAELGGSLYLPLAEPFASEAVAIAIPKGESEFLSFLNGWVEMMVSERWFVTRNAHWSKTDASESR